MNKGFSEMKEAPWPDLEAFLAVARTGGLSQGAKALGTSAPTLGRRIAALEARLDVTLFAKDTTGYRTTAAAAALLEAAEGVEQAMFTLLRRLDGLSAEIAGTVRIAVPETIATHLLAPQLSEIRSAHPALHVEFATGPTQVSLPERAADIAVRLGNPGEANLYARKVGEIEFAAFAPRQAGLLLDDEPDFRTVPWIGYSAVFRDLPLARQTNARFNAEKQTGAADSLLVQVQMAKSLSAAVVLPTFFGMSEPDLALVSDDAILSLPVWLVTSEEARSAPRTQVTQSWLAGVLRQLR